MAASGNAGLEAQGDYVPDSRRVLGRPGAPRGGLAAGNGVRKGMLGGTFNKNGPPNPRWAFFVNGATSGPTRSTAAAVVTVEKAKAMPAYHPQRIEPKWQAEWDGTRRSARRPRSVPAQALYPRHVSVSQRRRPSRRPSRGLYGHRHRLPLQADCGYNVLHPMGWDAFGLPAEQYAVQTNTHPRITTQANIDTFRRQIKSLGFSYDWDREVDTTDPGYYKWTQWIFLKIYDTWYDPDFEWTDRQGSRARARAVRSPSCRSPLGPRIPEPIATRAGWPTGPRSPSTGAPAGDRARQRGSDRRQKRARRVSGRADAAHAVDAADHRLRRALIEDLEDVDWPGRSRTCSQLGRPERRGGSRFPIRLGKATENIRVYTTRPDTLFGATYMVLAPEHPLVDRLTSEAQRPSEKYRQAAATKSDLDRTELAKTKTGVFTAAYAMNPVNGQSIPVWIADYVLMGYGTGAIMAVPGTTNATSSLPRRSTCRSSVGRAGRRQAMLR